MVGLAYSFSASIVLIDGMTGLKLRPTVYAHMRVSVGALYTRIQSRQWVSG